MTDRTSRGALAPPPSAMFGAAAPGPRVTTLTPEIRTDAGITIDEPDLASLVAHARAELAPLILWRVELGWREADKVQAWLTGAPPGGIARTREAALRDFVNTRMLAGDPPAPFLEYRGAFLTTETSHAHYCFVLAMIHPVPWRDYQHAWPAALDSLGPPTDPWRQDLTWLLKNTVGLATSQVDALRPAAEVGDLRALGPDGRPKFPVIRMLLD